MTVVFFLAPDIHVNILTYLLTYLLAYLLILTYIRKTEAPAGGPTFPRSLNVI